MSGLVTSVMRQSDDVQWWYLTAPVSGTYTVRLSDLPAAYRLAIFHPSGSRSVWSSNLNDRVITQDLVAGQRITVSVEARNSNGDLSNPYRLSVTTPAMSGLGVMSADRMAEFMAR